MHNRRPPLRCFSGVDVPGERFASADLPYRGDIALPLRHVQKSRARAAPSRNPLWPLDHERATVGAFGFGSGAVSLPTGSSAACGPGLQSV